MMVEAKEFTVSRTVDDGKNPKGREEDTVVKIEPVPLMLVRLEMTEGRTHGRSVAGHGRSVAGAWPGRGRCMAGAWPGHGQGPPPKTQQKWPEWPVPRYKKNAHRGSSHVRLVHVTDLYHWDNNSWFNVGGVMNDYNSLLLCSL